MRLLDTLLQDEKGKKAKTNKVMYKLKHIKSSPLRFRSSNLTNEHLEGNNLQKSFDTFVTCATE